MPAMSWVALWGMILTEHGLYLRRDGDRGRCVEHPEMVMLRGGGYEVGGQGFDTLIEAVAARDEGHQAAVVTRPRGNS